MKAEVRCPDCNSAWHVDAPATGEMLCPSCMKRIPLDGSTTVRSVDPREQVLEHSGPSKPAVAPPVTGAGATGSTGAVTDAAPAGSTPEWMYNEVVCPRCNLHFEPRRRPRAENVARKTILVVDDLEYFRQLAKEALEPTFVVETAATRAEAHEVLASKQIDLLVLDLTLDGCNAGRDMLSELSPKPCPILIFTAQDESEMYGENWDELKRLGADDLVIKGMQVAESLVRKASVLLGVPVDEEQPIG
jgi:CheY-like chemotaxis protein